MIGRTITLQQFKDILPKVPRALSGAMLRGVRYAGQDFAGRVIQEIHASAPYPPIDHETMVDSVHSKSIAGGAIVSVDTPYAKFMEYGTRPHWPPIGVLKMWAFRTFGDPALGFSIAREIARRGIAPRGFWRRAVQELPRLVKESVEIELRAVEL